MALVLWEWEAFGEWEEPSTDVTLLHTNFPVLCKAEDEKLVSQVDPSQHL